MRASVKSSPVIRGIPSYDTIKIFRVALCLHEAHLTTFRAAGIVGILWRLGVKRLRNSFGVYGGKAEIMNNISPDGPVYQAGTLSGNPIAVSAGTALLKQLGNKEIYNSMEQNAKSFLNPIKEYADELKMPFSFNVRGGMFGFFFSNSLPKNFDDVQNTNIELFSKFFRKMLEKNIYLPPSAYESCFISTLHDEAKMLKAAKLAQESLKEIKDEI